MAVRKTSKGGPFTEAEFQELRRLHAEGKRRNEIATLMRRSPRTISVYAEQLGLSFDRTATAMATQAKVIDAKARKAEIILRTYARIEKLHDRLDATEGDGYKFTTTTVHGIETEALDHVPAQEEKHMAGALTQYLGQVLKLEALDGDPGLDAARSMLGALAEGVQKIVNSGADEDSSLE